MRFCVLASSSRANAILVTHASTTLLIDCGLSARTLTERMKRAGIDPCSLSAVLLTHEHDDHVRGLRQLQRKVPVPVWTAVAVAEPLTDNGHSLGRHIRCFAPGAPFGVDDLAIQPFSISHDAVDPVGFRISAPDGATLTICTDLGEVTDTVRAGFRGCHAAILEFNHDEDRLWACDYPWDVKRRIASSHGHLSNRGAAELVSSEWHDALRHLVLAHLSERSNSPALALHALQCGLGAGRSLHAVCASHIEATPWMDVGVAGDDARVEEAA